MLSDSRYPKLVAIGVLSALGLAAPATAQIIPDATLGAESSRLTSNVLIQGANADRIDGGAQRGGNLFHSFSQFNLAAGQSLYFNNPVGVRNILTRVTGAASNIQGTLGINGSANLFLINPRGVFFGPNARLDMRGSFVTTTANAIQFGNQGVFNASVPDAVPLLNIDPSALLFNQTQAIVPNIQIDRAQLSVDPGKSLGLIGGNLQFDGGQIGATGGRIELAGVVTPGIVEMNLNTDQLNLMLPTDATLGNIRLSQAAQVSAQGDNAAIVINANQLKFNTGAQVLNGIASTGNSGDITVNSRTLEIDGLYSGISQRLTDGAIGNTGNIVINADLIAMSNGGEIITAGYTNSIGNIGDVRIKSNNLYVNSGSKIVSENFNPGRTGKIAINNTDTISVDSGLIFARNAVNSRGAVGDLTIATKNLSLLNGGAILNSTRGAGSGGNLTVTATDTLTISGFSATNQSLSILGTNTVGSGRGGQVTIVAPQINLRDGGGISSQTISRDPAAIGGDIRIKSNQIEIAGVSPRLDVLNARKQPAGIGSETGGDPTIRSVGKAGNIAIDTDRLIVRDGGIITSSALNDSAGNSGNVTINATDLIQVGGGSYDEFALNVGLSIIRTETFGDSNAGNLSLNTGRLNVKGGGLVSSRAFSTSTGQGGNLTIAATQGIDVAGSLPNAPFDTSSVLTTRSDNAQSAGQLNILTDRLRVSDRGQISAEATAGGTANSLTIKAKQVSVSNGASISVNSPTGFAGQLNITAQRIALNQGNLTATTGLSEAQRQGAEINLNGVEVLLLRRGALINATANNQAIGGNLNINSTFIVAVPNEDSDIRANAFQGRGGNILIATQGIFGTAPLPESRLGLSDITASSQLGTQGTIAITQPDVQPEQGLVELPGDILDVSNQIGQSCPNARNGRTAGQFVVSGRGSLPTSPLEPLADNPNLPALAELKPDDRPIAQTSAPPITQTTPAIVEAQGWRKTPDGKVVLIAQPVRNVQTFASTGRCPSN
jgi:filamentous hemagglutinin family protein